MRDIELYEGILGLTPPWKVDGVKLDIVAKTVEVESRVERRDAVEE